jgi:hypothetical protein
MLDIGYWEDLANLKKVLIIEVHFWGHADCANLADGLIRIIREICVPPKQS